ncbi:HAD-superfamily hydrolase, partial [Cryphonectria parasitica EP155]
EFAIAFDIDGVLVRGKQPIPSAGSALDILRIHSVPFILLTNGGGLTEFAHAKRVSTRVGVSIREDQFVQSHTPFRHFVDQYQGKYILALGGYGDQIREVAVAYGFDWDYVLTSSDLVKHFPSIHPFPEMTQQSHLLHGKLHDNFAHEPPISAILVFSSPRDWCLDLQLCLDLLLSEGGRLGTRSTKNGNTALDNAGYQQDGQPALYFCNPDLEWATSHSQPRLAQGAFRAALEGVWSGITQGHAQLQAWTCGKPTATTYEFAEAAIQLCHARLRSQAATALRTVYMVGDNPESDIQGALLANNAHGAHPEWRSVLVKSGVYTADSPPRFEPTVIKDDIWEAVRWVIQ